MMSMMVSFFVLSFFPRGVLDEILNLIESVSGVFSSSFFFLFRNSLFKIITVYTRAVLQGPVVQN